MSSCRPDPPRSARGARRTLLAALLGALALAGAAPGGAAPAGARATDVLVARAREAAVSDRVEALGTLRANETVALRATVTERITEVHFDDNDRVEAGDVLVEMTSAEESAQLEEARSTVEEAQAQYDRFRPLAEQGIATQSDLDLRRRDLEAARARLRAVEARLGDRLILAPFDGVLGLRDISRGALVAPGDVITTINDDSVMKLDMSVPSTYLPALRPGLRIEARARALGDQVFEGHISAIDNAVDPVTRSIQVRALVPNPEGRLLPGLLMTVTLFADERRAVLVPEGAVVQRGQQAFVYVTDAAAGTTTAERRDVRTGTRFAGEIEILSGLEAGETVVTDGIVKIRPGATVRVVAVDTGERSLTALLQEDDS